MSGTPMDPRWQDSESDRALDALIASETDTSIDDAQADRLLAFLAEREAEAAGPQRRVLARFAWGALLAAGVAGLWLGVAAGGAERPDELRPDEARAEPAAFESEGPVGERPESEGPGGAAAAEGQRGEPRALVARAPFPASLPVQWSPDPQWPARDHFAPAELLRALRGESVLGLDGARLADEAETLLLGVRPDAIPAPLLVAPMPRAAAPGVRVPSADAEHAELVLAAADWQVRRLRRRGAGPDELQLLLHALRASEGTLRLRLADRLRALEAEWATRAERMLRGAARRQSEADEAFVAGLGALGCRAAIPVLRRLAFAELTNCARQARATGDETALDFLFELALAVTRREPEAPVHAWFEDLDAAQRAWLYRRIARQVDTSPRFEERERLAQMRSELFAE